MEIDGDAEVQQAVRFALFHVLQAGARAENRAIPAKGLTGPGYDGHAFWDTETFVLPVLTLTAPDAAANALRWRHSTLPLAIERAAPARPEGRRVPVAHDRGRGVLGLLAGRHGRLPRQRRHRRRRASATSTPPATRSSTAGPGMDLLAHTARLWRSLGHHDAQGRFHIDGVTGPDEYSAIADNNVYTNLMAQQNLLEAAEAAKRYPDRARDLGIDAEEAASWRDAAEAMIIPYDETLGVHPQAEGFTRHQVWDFAHTAPDQYPLLLHFPYFDLYRKQVVKQADLVLAMHLRGDAFTAEQKAAQLRLLRGAHGAGLLAVGLHPGGHGRRGRAPGPGLRLPRRGGADGPAGPGAQHPRRRAHRLAGRYLDRAGRPASAACATRTARSASRRGFPTG